MNGLRAWWLLFAMLAWSAGAHAQRAAVTDALPGEGESDLRMGPHLGGYVSDQADGILLGFNALARYRFVQGGALLEYGGQVFGDNMIAAAAAGGLCVMPASDVRIDMLGVLGARRYMGVGAGFLDDDPGASATLGYAGALWGVSYVFGSANTTRRYRASFGARAGFDADLARVDVDYSYEDDSWDIFGPTEPEIVMRHRVLGATRVFIALHYGVVFDL
jgi:hypothetical protein